VTEELQHMPSNFFGRLLIAEEPASVPPMQPTRTIQDSHVELPVLYSHLVTNSEHSSSKLVVLGDVSCK